MSSTTNTVYTPSSLINMLPSEPSVCVPRIYMNISKERVYDVFADLFGHTAIERVDMIERQNKEGEPYKRAFVHFKSWPRTEQSTEVRLKLLNGEEVKVVYDQPWYWRISASRLPRPEDQPPRRKDVIVPSRPFIMIDEDVPQKRRERPQQQVREYDQDRRGGDYRRQPRETHYEPRRYDDHRREQQQPRYYHRSESSDCYGYDDRDRNRTQHYKPRQNEYRGSREQNYQRRMDDHRPPNIRTPHKEPEIATWVSAPAPGAPGPKGKKPRLLLDEKEEGTGTASESSNVKTARCLSFEEDKPSTERISEKQDTTNDNE